MILFTQRIMQIGFDWDTDDISILLQAKLAKPLVGTARIIINSIHIKGDVSVVPVILIFILPNSSRLYSEKKKKKNTWEVVYIGFSFCCCGHLLARNSVHGNYNLSRKHSLEKCFRLSSPHLFS